MEKVYKWLIDNKKRLIYKFIFKMIKNKNDIEDFYQDLILIIGEMEEEKVVAILERGEMERYMYIIIKNNLLSNSSRHYKTYVKSNGYSYIEEYDTRECIDNNKTELLLEIEEMYKDLNDEINEHLYNKLEREPKFFFDKTIFDMYYNCDEKITIRGLGNKLDIPYNAIFNSLKKTRKYIESKFGDKVKNIKSRIIYINKEIDLTEGYNYGDSIIVNFDLNNDAY